MTSPRHSLGQLGPAVRLLLLMTVLLGLAYPLLVTGIAQVAFPGHAEGSLVHRDGKVVGSSLIGQSYDAKAEYFQSRPSAAGDKGYDPLSTSASNLALDSTDLVKDVKERRAAARTADGTSTVAPDALLASGSGLDPHISPAYAEQQVARVAQARDLSTAQVERLVEQHTQARTLGFLGEPRVNVLELNLALDRATDATD